MLIYLITENYSFNNNQTWIIDTLAQEFAKYSQLKFTNKIEEATLVWIIGYNYDEINKLKKLTNLPYIITTIHHIDKNDPDSIIKFIQTVDNITCHYHVICQKVENDLKSLTNKPIRVANFWINQNIFYHIENQQTLRQKYNLSDNTYIVGSFQRDTMGKDKCLKPKLSKGPDILIKILIDIQRTKPNLLLLLTGKRRNYIIDQCIKHKIPYIYLELVTNQELNELYNTLDLYIVSSRVEGGPRAIMECGLTKTPIISTDVGIASLILDHNSIYDSNNYLSYQKAEPNTGVAYQNTIKYNMDIYISQFIQQIIN